MTIIAFLIVFGVLILIHELGHFITAKLAGVKVQEFGMGYPPRIFGITRGETVYSLNWLPLGGFVKLLGEEDPSHPQSLAGKSRRVRTLVISAGALMNLFLALFLFAIVFMVPQKAVFHTVAIQSVADGSPAALAGLQPGDVVKKVNGRKIRNINDLRYQYQLRLGAKATTVVERNGALLSINVTPRWKPPAGQGPTGISIAEPEDERTASYREPFLTAVPHAFRQAGETLVLTRNGITKWFVGDADPLDDVAGPIGIARVTGEVAEHGTIVDLTMFAAFLSLNLAIMNILPIPALDGGRLLFVAIEFVRRGKRIPPQKEAMVHMIGFATLIAIMVIISVFDIQRIIRGENAIGG